MLFNRITVFVNVTISRQELPIRVYFVRICVKTEVISKAVSSTRNCTLDLLFIVPTMFIYRDFPGCCDSKLL